ncbi:MAG TPA: hypothetical protein PLU30_11365, partial [Verrucomicrobiae bacterium]|nr:hypothetical protein [Verrucomicrobiae bacterium]
INIDEGRIRGHLDKMVLETVEQTLNGLLDAEADRLCRAGRYERSAERLDTRAGCFRRLGQPWRVGHNPRGPCQPGLRGPGLAAAG